jgi:tRNA(Ile2) C34 agmatinyltransferase TiaS
MTLTELINKLNELIDYRVNKDSENNKNSEVYFFAEDEYNTFDVKIENVEIEDNKIFLS